MPLTLRYFGDPVLRQPAAPVAEREFPAMAALVDEMTITMKAAPGVGLAAPQVGVRKRFFIYDTGDRQGAVVNPEIVESDGTWSYDEGCLSIPGLVFPLERPKDVHVRGFDLDGNPVDLEASEYFGRVLQHEIDHLDGKLVLDRVDPDVRKAALKVLRHRALGLPLNGLPAGIRAGQSVRQEL